MLANCHSSLELTCNERVGFGARDRNRTDTSLSRPGILSPVRLPVSPPGRVERDPHPEKRLCGHAAFQSSIENIIGASCGASAERFQLGERVQVPSGGRSH